MKKIELDEENGTVLLEPGVGFFDLYDYIQERKIPLWLSVPGNSWGSVAGNALDRGVGYTPYGDHSMQICGLEVVMPTGEVIRTGMGAMKGSPNWLLYRNGYGPGWDQMFVQSNFGIVTKMGTVADARARSADGHRLRIRQARGHQLGDRHDHAAAARGDHSAGAFHGQLAAVGFGDDHANAVDQQHQRRLTRTSSLPSASDSTSVGGACRSASMGRSKSLRLR